MLSSPLLMPVLKRSICLDGSTHILRHSYATMALIATRDISAVQASLGHAEAKDDSKVCKSYCSS